MLDDFHHELFAQIPDDKKEALAHFIKTGECDNDFNSFLDCNTAAQELVDLHFEAHARRMAMIYRTAEEQKNVYQFIEKLAARLHVAFDKASQIAESFGVRARQIAAEQKELDDLISGADPEVGHK